MANLSYCYSPYAQRVNGVCAQDPAPNTGAVIDWSKDNLTGEIRRFHYDSHDRITSVSAYNGHSYAFAYDKDGNRTTVSADGKQTQNLGMFTNVNFIQQPGYVFDNQGNQTQDPTIGTMSYNAAGQMTFAGGRTYTYAGPDQRELVEAASNSAAQYAYGKTGAKGNPELEQVTYTPPPGSATSLRGTFYIYNDANGQPLAFSNGSNEPLSYVKDGEGSVVDLIGGGGAVFDTYTYDPYGNTIATTVNEAGDLAAANPIGYAGGVRSNGSLIKFGQRWYNPNIGRFTQQDPITELLNPSNANQYAYAADDPLNKTDPSGRYDEGDACIDSPDACYAQDEPGSSEYNSAAAGGEALGGALGIAGGAGLAGIGVDAAASGGAAAGIIVGAGLIFGGLIGIGVGAYLVYDATSG